MIENNYREEYESWDDLPGEAQEALGDWYNIQNPTKKSKALPLSLWNAGAFRAWNCPMCGEQCAEGDPEAAGLSWDDFQGVRNPDGSYFSDDSIFTEEFIRLCCDTCRCHPQRFFPGSSVGDYP